MTGLELSEKYYEEYGKAMIHEQFPELEAVLCTGLIGAGSECFGFDDDISKDHDFEPGFCIFLPEEALVSRRQEFELERAYSKLPCEFMGLRRSLAAPVGGRRRGVIRLSEFLKEKLGTENGELTQEAWLKIPAAALAEFTNGKIFRDDSGILSAVRQRTAAMPEDIRLKRLAGNILIMAQAGQYNYSRCTARGEGAAAQLAVFEFSKAAIETVFLLNRSYAPYYKWAFRAMDRLPLLSCTGAYLEFLMTTPNDESFAEDKYLRIEDVAADIIELLKKQQITEASCGDLEKHAYSVNDHIQDPNIRNLNIFYAV